MTVLSCWNSHIMWLNCCFKCWDRSCSFLDIHQMHLESFTICIYFCCLIFAKNWLNNSVFDIYLALNYWHIRKKMSQPVLSVFFSSLNNIHLPFIHEYFWFSVDLNFTFTVYLWNGLNIDLKYPLVSFAAVCSTASWRARHCCDAMPSNTMPQNSKTCTWLLCLALIECLQKSLNIWRKIVMCNCSRTFSGVTKHSEEAA